MKSSAEPMRDIDSAAQSPCIGICCLDDDYTCLGCFRSLEEINEWRVVDNHRRRIILQNAKQRREAYQMLGEVSPHSIWAACKICVKTCHSAESPTQVALLWWAWLQVSGWSGSHQIA